MAGCVFWVDRIKYGIYEEQKIVEAQIKRESKINIEIGQYLAINQQLNPKNFVEEWRGSIRKVLCLPKTPGL